MCNSIYNKMVKKLGGLIVLILAFGFFLNAALDISTVKLENGVTVILSPQKNIQATCILTYHKNGTRHDPQIIRGISFLYQYLMMLRTEHLEDYERIMLATNNGGKSTGRVNTDFSFFSQVLPDHIIGNALWHEQERLKKLMFFDRTLHQQKLLLFRRYSSILRENVNYRALNWVRTQVFSGTVYEKPVFGDLERLRNYTNEQIHSRYKAFRNPEDIILVVAGNFNQREILSLIRNNFIILKNNLPNINDNFTLLKPRNTYLYKSWLVENSKNHFVLYGFRTPGLMSHEYILFEILRYYLTSPRHSLLTRVLNRDNHLNVKISYENTHNYEGNALIIKISSRSRVELERAKHILNKQLQALKDFRIPSGDLNSVKSMVEIDFLKKMHVPETRSLWLAENLRLFNKADRQEEYLKKIRKASSLDINRMCKKYLDKQNRVILNVYKK